MKRLLILLFCFGAVAAAAHPHVRFQYALEPIVRDGMLTGLRIEWTMDEAASATALAALDPDGDGELDARLAARFAAGNAALLARRDYLLTLTHAGATLPFSIAQPLAVMRRGAHLVLSFAIGFAPLPPGAPLRARLFDESWYVAFSALATVADVRCAQHRIEERLPTQGWGEQTVAAVEIDCSRGTAVAQASAER